MSRKSPFLIALDRNERSELESRARKYTSSYRDVVRAKIVLCAAQGLANDAIAARLDTPRQIVSKWRGVSRRAAIASRSEEHTSELQSRPHLVCRLLLAKKYHNNSPLCSV